MAEEKVRSEARSERRRDRSEGEIKVARSSSKIERRGAIIGLELGLWSPDGEMSGSELGLVFARCVDCSVWLGVWIGASQALCASERAASSACERGVENV